MAQSERYKRVKGQYIPVQPTQGICQSCNRQMLGRLDKKFCDHLCRNDYHNAQRKLKKELEKCEH